MDKNSEEFQQDWFGILGLDCTVKPPPTTVQIGKAARDFAFKYHPDKNPDPDAKAMFELGQKAKDILMDETKRTTIINYYKIEAERKALRAQRDSTMDKDRKRMRDSLESNIKRAQEEAKKPSQEQVLQNAIRKQKQTMDEINRKNAKIFEETAEYAQNKAFQKAQDYEKARNRAAEDLLSQGKEARQIKIKWRKTAESHSDDTLYQIFKRYGDIEDVTLSATKGTNGIITYKMESYARAAYNAYVNNEEEFKVSLVKEDKKKANIFTFDYQKSSSSQSLNGMYDSYQQQQQQQSVASHLFSNDPVLQKEMQRVTEIDTLTRKLEELRKDNPILAWFGPTENKASSEETIPNTDKNKGDDMERIRTFENYVVTDPDELQRKEEEVFSMLENNGFLAK